MTPRRVVTGHDDRGRSVVLADGPVPKSHPLAGAVFHELWNTPSVPAPVTAFEAREPTDRPLVTPPDPGGTIIRIVDLEPGSVSPMHRTESIDYGIVLTGQVHLVLDDGSQTRLDPGDVVDPARHRPRVGEPHREAARRWSSFSSTERSTPH